LRGAFFYLIIPSVFPARIPMGVMRGFPGYFRV